MAYAPQQFSEILEDLSLYAWDVHLVIYFRHSDRPLTREKAKAKRKKRFACCLTTRCCGVTTESSRFIYNCPEEEFESLDRICFQIELAHWFYEDFYREHNLSLPKYRCALSAPLCFAARARFGIPLDDCFFFDTIYGSLPNTVRAHALVAFSAVVA
jgi:hypothetical protein